MDTDSFKSQVRCAYDGTYERYHAKNGGTGRCVECENYRRRIASGLIVGIDNRTETQKKIQTPEKKLTEYHSDLWQHNVDLYNKQKTHGKRGKK